MYAYGRTPPHTTPFRRLRACTELFIMKDITGGDFVGDFRNDAIDFGWDSFEDDTKYFKRGVELNQGRAAQMGLLGLMVHEKLGVSILP